MKKYLGYSILSSVLLVPFVASAQLDAGNSISTFINEVVGFINEILIPILLALAFLVFIWGAVKFFFLADDGANKEAGKNAMLYGIIGFVVIVSIWGIVALLANGLGLNDDELQTVPTAPVTR